ncbi:Short-chain dehydrogenase TIC 32, chloroplastic [Orchesella cincta]|uniref:Short-chain dehydrogenase TIC 32, chloroplastic n=1 Tax=Orchesella cincta TaxID=48709 RepID=A0A1D2MUN2_ORCCI|nr:Short-chain dehydrogenase TIC 32, chloroplastic [Orchesella cincta]
MCALSVSSKPPGIWYKRLHAYVVYDIFYMVVAGVIALWNEFTVRPPILQVEQIAKRTGHVAVLTGGPRGLALGLIKTLVQLDYNVVMGVRDVDDSQRRLDEFSKSNPDLSLKKITFLEMDLKSLQSVRKFADGLLNKVSRIDLLLCNAAVMKSPYELTKDGFESQFQVNYLSHFLLTHLLLGKIKATAAMKSSPCQIIFTSSMMYAFGRVDFNELEKSAVYTSTKAYLPTKLCQVMGMLTFQKQLLEDDAQVYCYAVHPGLIPTDLWLEAGGPFIARVAQLINGIFRTVKNGADTILWPAFGAEYQNQGGLYLESGKSVNIASKALDKEVQAKLNSKSKELAGIL